MGRETDARGDACSNAFRRGTDCDLRCFVDHTMRSATKENAFAHAIVVDHDDRDAGGAFSDRGPHWC